MINVISTKGLLDIIVSVGRRFTDDYVRECFLIVLSSIVRMCFAFQCHLDPSTYTLLLENVDVILLSLTTCKPFVPQSTSYASLPSSTAVLRVFNTVLGIDEKPKEPRLRVLELCSVLAEHGTDLE